ncbi:MAG: minor capsid protein [Ruminococcaceae bacterium]|nr:minor capsid protein [Oscillospiraceae bacterium]
MLTPGEIEALSMAFDKQMRALETQVMTDIIRRIRINGEITRSADWQMHRLQQMGYAKSDIEEAIKKHLNLSDEDMEEMYKKIVEEGYARDTELYNKAGIDRIPFEENYTLQQSISAIALQTSNEMKNISQSLGFAVRNTDGSLSFTPAAEYYQNTLDNAINGISQGVFDYNTAIKRAVSEMTNSGLRTVDYASGWSNRVDVAARRAIMTGLSQLTGKVNDMNAEELGTDTFEVTRHGGARPSHQVWQGKWYTKEELISVCGLGTVTGLHGANCYHDYYPVIPGISEPSYTAEELEELNRQENTPVKYGDKEYTKYEALQRQRRLETTMRAQRQKIKLLKEGGADEDDIIAARARYRGTSAEYTRFSEAMKLPQQRQRVTVDGLGNIGQGKWKLKNESERRSKDDYNNIEKTKVKWDAVNSEKWSNNFDNITDNDNVNNTIRDVSEQMLKHRDGTFYESMYLINAKTGKLEGFNTTSNLKLKVALTDKMKAALNNPDLDLIGVHNHPFSSIPSLGDLNAIAKRSNQSMGVIVCHDGTIFTYTKPKCEISEQVYNASLTKYSRYSKITMEDKGFGELGDIYEFEFKRYEL